MKNKMIELKNERTGEIYRCNEPSDYIKPEQFLRLTYEERLKLYHHHKSQFDVENNTCTFQNLH